MEYCQVDQHTHFGSHEEDKKKGAEGRFEEIITENFPNLMKNMNINNQEAKQILESNKLKDIHIETYYNQNHKRQRENLESIKSEANCHIQVFLDKIISRFLIRNFGNQKRLC